MTFKTFKFGRFLRIRFQTLYIIMYNFFGEFYCDPTSINIIIWGMLKSIYVSLNIEFCILFLTFSIFSPTPKPMFSCLVFRVVVYLCFSSSLFSPLFFFVIRFRNASSHSVGYTSLSTCFQEEFTLHLFLSFTL